MMATFGNYIGSFEFWCFVDLGSIDVHLSKNPSTGMARQWLILVFKVVLHAVVVISELLRSITKSRCSRCCMVYLYYGVSGGKWLLPTLSCFVFILPEHSFLLRDTLSFGLFSFSVSNIRIWCIHSTDFWASYLWCHCNVEWSKL